MDTLLDALAKGDFDGLARCFEVAGLRVSLPGPGMLRIDAGAPASMRLLISVGVHGNETAPIEMMAQVLASLARTPGSLAVDLLIVVGNPVAIAQARRFIDADLNRLFGPERGSLGEAAEAARADLIMQASTDFFAVAAGQGGVTRWHLDLHTAIRPSHFERFAIIPDAAGDPAQAALGAWLGSAGIDALVFNDEAAPTYSAFTAHVLGAVSSTVELGRVGRLGDNALAPLARTRAAVERLLRGQAEPSGADLPLRFRVAQEIIKRSEAFAMAIGPDTHNFTEFAPGALIATDGPLRLQVGAVPEHVVFPNPDVLVGQRAGLMVVQIKPEVADVTDKPGHPR
ncbi:MAG: succinylglutamate desuccinylase [Herminiimonas sp.]|nr:succinylglutamate desuccinylase [Herminiimonas sp.]